MERTGSRLLDTDEIEHRLIALAAERGMMLPALTPARSAWLMEEVAWGLTGIEATIELGAVVRAIVDGLPEPGT